MLQLLLVQTIDFSPRPPPFFLLRQLLLRSRCWWAIDPAWQWHWGKKNVLPFY